MLQTCTRRAANLVQVSGGDFPGTARKVDVVRVVHLAQVVEAASLRKSRIILS